ncbi:MAG: hypothetical protein LBG92_00355 [Prevotellaceae bacterium]|jgi:hypothetical protein|nr:hypothetical protein [Prevotellaceae bacterium]
MLLTDYYKFRHLPESKSKHRIDCVASTVGYPDFECLRNRKGKLFLYLGDVPAKYGGDVHKKADKCLTNQKNISSLYYPDLDFKTIGFGDIWGTLDALVIVGNANYTEFDIFIARGQKNNRLNIWQNFVAGELDFDVADLKGKATSENKCSD